MSKVVEAKNLVQGVGIYEKGQYLSKAGKKHTKEYALWRSMLVRCYSKYYQEKYSTYEGCYVSENFKNFQFFAEWCNKQVGFGLKDYHLDKDLLSGSGKSYSEDTCVFIPLKLNLILLTKPALMKELPVGVAYCDKANKYFSRCTFDGKCKFLGYSDTVEEAVAQYQKAKQKYVRETVEQYKNVIDMRVYKFFADFEISVDNK